VNFIVFYKAILNNNTGFESSLVNFLINESAIKRWYCINPRFQTWGLL